jgi:hypothetical protein
MKRVLVIYLKNGSFYTDGQSLTDKEGSMMSSDKAEYYLEKAKERGLSLDFEAGHLDVPDDEGKAYEELGYPVVSLP